MRGYAELGVQHIMFQCWPYTPEARQRLTEALQLYRGMQQQDVIDFVAVLFGYAISGERTLKPSTSACNPLPLRITGALRTGPLTSALDPESLSG